MLLCCCCMRTQVDLRPEQHAKAKAKAAALGITLAEYMRRLVDRDLDDAEPAADPSSIFALGNSGGSDIAAELNVARSAKAGSKFAAVGDAVASRRRPA